MKIIYTFYTKYNYLNNVNKCNHKIQISHMMHPFSSVIFASIMSKNQECVPPVVN